MHFGKVTIARDFQSALRKFFRCEKFTITLEQSGLTLKTREQGGAIFQPLCDGAQPAPVNGRGDILYVI